jgi:alpha-ketoglutarate-dependent taurine dioxygenase
MGIPRHAEPSGSPDIPDGRSASGYALIDELAEHTIVLIQTRPHWQAGDLPMWDNCTVQHLARLAYEWPKHRRLMQRIS